MTQRKKLQRLLAQSPSGTLRTREVSAAGMYRGLLQQLQKEGEIACFGRGIYVHKDAWEDDLYLLQARYARGIYSHATALYLLGYSDRTPHRYTLTFPQGYHSIALEKEALTIYRAIPKNYDLGIIEQPSPNGNTIRLYNLEKTLCDLLRGNHGDIQLITEAMRRYAQSKTKDLHKLMQYAKQLRVLSKVQRYMEVLL